MVQKLAPVRQQQVTGHSADDESDLEAFVALQVEATVCHLLQRPDLISAQAWRAQAWYYCPACDQLPNKPRPGHCSAPNNRMWSSEATKLPKLVLVVVVVAAQTTPNPSPSR